MLRNPRVETSNKNDSIRTVTKRIFPIIPDNKTIWMKLHFDKLGISNETERKYYDLLSFLNNILICLQKVSSLFFFLLTSWRFNLKIE